MKKLGDIRIWLGILFLVIIAVVHFSGIKDQISVATILEKRHQLLHFVYDHYLSAVLLYIAIYIVIVILAVPLVSFATILAGFLFGIIPGTLFANIGATIGATIFFLLVRHSIGISLQEAYKDKLVWFNDEIDKYGTVYLIAIHFFVVIPFFVVNLLIGMTRVSLTKFIWTTSLGIIPGMLIYTFAGKQLAMINSARDIFSFPLVGALVLLALLALLPLMAKRWGWWGLR